VPNLATQGDLNLESVMLAVPLPGLTGFSLVGPGATNGVLTSETLGSYSNNPAEVEHLFDQYSSESGFAGWIKTWQNHGASDAVVEIAIRFHDSAEATTNAGAFVSTLSQGISGGTRTNVSSIPGAIGFSINESAITSGTTVVPAQQVQAIVFSDGDYFVALHTDSLTGSGDQSIAQGTADALALQQYQYLAPLVNPPQAPNSHSAPHGSGGSSALIVGIALLGAVALVIIGFAVLSRRRRDRIGSEAGSRSDQPRAEPVSTVPRRHRQSNSRPRTRTVLHQTGARADKARGTEKVESGNGARTNGAGKAGGADKASAANGSAETGNGQNGSGLDDDRLVGAGASKRTGPDQRFSASRSRHPSAVALANIRPPETAPGWYPDPSDDERKRIRFWDGAGWTAHVAEPKN
jgi:Protein of unknown function (DUF2510)